MGEPITKPLLGDKIETEVNRASHLPAAQAAKQVRAAVLSDPIIQRATTPIAWYKSQAILGNIVAFGGGVALAAPQIANIFPEWSDPILKWGGLAGLLIGIWNGVKGRVNTSRPIGS